MEIGSYGRRMLASCVALSGLAALAPLPLAAQSQRLDALGIGWELPTGWRLSTDSQDVASMRTRLLRISVHPETGMKVLAWGACGACVADPAQNLADQLDFLAVQAGNATYQTTRSPTETMMGTRRVHVAAGTARSRTDGQESLFAAMMLLDDSGLALNLRFLGPIAGADALGTALESLVRSFAVSATEARPVPDAIIGAWQRSANLGGGFGQGGNNTEESWRFRADGTYHYRYASSTYVPGASISPTLSEYDGWWRPVGNGSLVVFSGTDGTARLVEYRREGAALHVDGVRFIQVP